MRKRRLGGKPPSRRANINVDDAACLGLALAAPICFWTLSFLNARGAATRGGPRRPFVSTRLAHCQSAAWRNVSPPLALVPPPAKSRRRGPPGPGTEVSSGNPRSFFKQPQKFLRHRARPKVGGMFKPAVAPTAAGSQVSCRSRAGHGQVTGSVIPFRNKAPQGPASWLPAAPWSSPLRAQILRMCPGRGAQAYGHCAGPRPRVGRTADAT